VRKADETSGREKRQRLWVWLSTTPVVTIFRLLTPRGAAGAKELFGEAVCGSIGTDHYAGYQWIAPRPRQLCWAHPIRTQSTNGSFCPWS